MPAPTAPDRPETDRDHVAAPAAARLRGAGLRVTGPRLAVLQALEADRSHPDTAQIVAVARRLGDMSTQAVYDILAALARVGLVRRIEPAGHPARFETRVGDNHHHLVCRSCGAVEDVDCVVGSPACLTPSDARGFAVDEAEITFWGLCPACTPVRTAPAAPPRKEEPCPT